MSARKSGKKRAINDPHRLREESRYEKPIASREFIISTLRAEAGPVDLEALAQLLGIAGQEVASEALRRRVGAMIRDGQLVQNRRRGLIPVDTDSLIAGRISAHPDGFGFVIVDDSDKDVYLNGKQMRQVLHGDRVVVNVTGTDARGRREGRIVDVVERANRTLVGRVSIDRGTVVVLPDNKRIHQDLLIAPGELGSAVDGDMVVAEIIEQPTRRHQPVGRIAEVLGQHLKAGMEIDVALHSHGIPVQWPQAVLDEAASFATTVDAELATDRMDVRKLSLVTIDGLDARDFDDAVWCERLTSGGWRLLVAIADVAHYVETGSALDTEAVDRGTSVYFPGRVVPMLPEVLSNGLCSLNPDVDRLCMICEMTLDLQGSVTKTKFHNGLMRSHARLTYDQVNEILTDNDSQLHQQYTALIPMINELHAIYRTLAATRRERGAIEFDSNETHIVFDDNKKIKEIVPIVRNDAHKLIEECMILANIQAAALLEEREIPTLYRVHAGPKADRLEDLRAFIGLRGLSLTGGDSPTALDYAALAAAIADLPDRSVIQTVMLRSMQQAVYQPANAGHFGLAIDQYAHFTSPIRRYPDLLVHRAIKYAIAKGRKKGFHYSSEAMQALGESCSVTERRAEEASRDVVSWLKCEYMQDHVGSQFNGVVTAVTSFGLFVELEGIHVEGLIHITNLDRDYYRFDQASHTLNGERTGRQYHLGDRMLVEVAAVNLEERKIDFAELQHFAKPSKKSRSSAKPPVAAPKKSGADQTHTRSAEQRRQQKRKRKQQRRDDKRAAAKVLATKDASTLSPHAKPEKIETRSDSDGKVDSRSDDTPLATAKKAAESKPSAKKRISKKRVAAKSKARASEKEVSEKEQTASQPDAQVAGKKKLTKKKVSKKRSAKKVGMIKKAAKKSSKPVSKVMTKKKVKKKAGGKKVAAKGKISKKSGVAKKSGISKKGGTSKKSGLAKKSSTGKKTKKRASSTRTRNKV